MSDLTLEKAVAQQSAAAEFDTTAEVIVEALALRRLVEAGWNVDSDEMAGAVLHTLSDGDADLGPGLLGDVIDAAHQYAAAEKESES